MYEKESFSVCGDSALHMFPQDGKSMVEKELYMTYCWICELTLAFNPSHSFDY